jgi:hypothetical protein
VFCLVLEFREENRTFTKIKGGNVDFFFISLGCLNVWTRGSTAYTWAGLLDPLGVGPSSDSPRWSTPTPYYYSCPVVLYSEKKTYCRTFLFLRKKKILSLRRHPIRIRAIGRHLFMPGEDFYQVVFGKQQTHFGVKCKSNMQLWR